MKNAMARKLHAVLGCPVYQETVQIGLNVPCCVILDPAYTVLGVRRNTVEVCAEYKIAVRGLEDVTEAVFYALSAVTDENGKVYRGEALSASEEDGVTLVRVSYRYLATVNGGNEEAPLMLSMALER